MVKRQAKRKRKGETIKKRGKIRKVMNGGKKETIRRAKYSHQRSFRFAMENALSGDASAEARALSRAMLRSASEFVDELCLWMDQTNEEMVVRYKLEKAEAWEMTCSCAAAVIAHVQMPRAAARDAMSVESPTDRCSLIIWAALGAHQAQEELLAAQFQRHPCLAPVYNLHLFKHRVQMTEFTVLKDDVKRLKGLSSIVQTLQNQVTNNKRTASDKK